MLRKMLAQVMFANPNDLNRGSAELIERGFDVEYLEEFIDDYTPAVWVEVRTISELDDHSFFDWVETIVVPVGGEVLEAGLLHRRPRAGSSQRRGTDGYSHHRRHRQRF